MGLYWNIMAHGRWLSIGYYKNTSISEYISLLNLFYMHEEILDDRTEYQLLTRLFRIHLYFSNSVNCIDLCANVMYTRLFMCCHMVRLWQVWNIKIYCNETWCQYYTRNIQKNHVVGNRLIDGFIYKKKRNQVHDIFSEREFIKSAFFLLPQVYSICLSICFHCLVQNLLNVTACGSNYIRILFV